MSELTVSGDAEGTGQPPRLNNDASALAETALSLTGVLDHLVESSEGETVRFGELLKSFDHRLFGPLILIPALIAVAPTGAIPGMSILTGALIFSIALQMLIMRAKPWLPERLLNFSFSRDKLIYSIDKARPITESIDRFIHPRATFLVKPPLLQVSAVVIMLLALSMFPLALLPFAVFFPGMAILIIALGITSQDGLVLVAGLVAALGAVYGIYAIYY